MLNEKDYKPMINELIDLTNQQRYLVENFLQRINEITKDEKILSACQKYVEALDFQTEALEKFSRTLQVTFEREEFQKLIAKNRN